MSLGPESPQQRQRFSHMIPPLFGSTKRKVEPADDLSSLEDGESKKLRKGRAAAVYSNEP